MVKYTKYTREIERSGWLIFYFWLFFLNDNKAIPTKIKKIIEYFWPLKIFGIKKSDGKI